MEALHPTHIPWLACFFTGWVWVYFEIPISYLAWYPTLAFLCPGLGVRVIWASYERNWLTDFWVRPGWEAKEDAERLQEREPARPGLQGRLPLKVRETREELWELELEMVPRQNAKLNRENMFQSNLLLTQDFAAGAAHSHHPRCSEGTWSTTRISGLRSEHSVPFHILVEI